MRANTLFISLGLLIMAGCFVWAAILIKPLNFLILEMAVIAIAALLYLSYRDVTNLVAVWLLALLFVFFSKTSLGIDMPNLSLDRMLWCFLAAYYLFALFMGRISLKRRMTELLMLILFCLAFFSVVKMKGVSMSRELLNIYSLLFNTYIAPFSVFVIAKDFIQDENKVRKLFTFLSVILLYLSLTAIFEHFRLNAFVFPRDIMNPNLGIHFGRARGPFLQAAINGTVMGILCITNLYMVFNARRGFRLFFIVIAVISPLAVFFTYTRAAWLGLVASFIFISFLNPRFRKYIWGLIFLGAIITVPLHAKVLDIDKVVARSSSMSPIYDRINLYYTYFNMIKDRPLLGFGFANFSNYSHEYFSTMRRENPYQFVIPEIHDSFMGVLVELGLTGFLIFMSILAVVFSKSIYLYRHSVPDGFLGRGIVVVFWGVAIIYLVNALFIDMKFHQFQNALFYMIAGIISGLSARKAGYE